MCVCDSPSTLISSGSSTSVPPEMPNRPTLSDPSTMTVYKSCYITVCLSLLLSLSLSVIFQSLFISALTSASHIAVSVGSLVVILQMHTSLTLLKRGGRSSF